MKWIVNELLNIIDLPSTLLRAQALFRRFQRTIEAVDKRNSFPSPTVRQRKPADKLPSPKSSNSDATSSVNERRRPGSSAGIDEEEEGKTKAKEKVISPELRQLLSKKVEVLDKTKVKEHGGGVGA